MYKNKNNPPEGVAPDTQRDVFAPEDLRDDMPPGLSVATPDQVQKLLGTIKIYSFGLT